MAHGIWWQHPDSGTANGWHSETAYFRTVDDQSSGGANSVCGDFGEPPLTVHHPGGYKNPHDADGPAFWPVCESGHLRYSVRLADGVTLPDDPWIRLAASAEGLPSARRAS